MRFDTVYTTKKDLLVFLGSLEAFKTLSERDLERSIVFSTVPIKSTLDSVLDLSSYFKVASLKKLNTLCLELSKLFELNNIDFNKITKLNLETSASINSAFYITSIYFKNL
jgi:hypothetical protein